MYLENGTVLMSYWKETIFCLFSILPIPNGARHYGVAVEDSLVCSTKIEREKKVILHAPTLTNMRDRYVGCLYAYA